MELADLQANFPPGVAVPEKLVKLLEFANRSRNWFSGHFDLEKCPYGDASAFDNDPEPAKQFVIFGRESDGSSYAYWLYDEKRIDEAPIVFIGSEGTDWGVIAETLEEFLGLLAVNSDELGFAASWGEIAETDGRVPRIDEFRKWLRQEFGIVAPTDPMAVVRNARAKHPDLQAFLTAWQEKHFGSA